MRDAKCRRGCTYHSALESVRVEPVLLPAAAEAKEVGAIVVVESCGRYDSVEALSFVVVKCGKLIVGSCESSRMMSSCKLIRAERARRVALEGSGTGERER